jgi:hypothetical protein
MGMDRDAIDRIVNLARSAEPIQKAPDFLNSGTYFVRNEDGTYEEQEAFFPRHEARFLTVESFALMVAREMEDHAERGVEVYYSPGVVKAVIYMDPDKPHRGHSLPLPQHPAFKRVVGLQSTQQFDQRSLVRFLRAELNGHVEEHVIEQFRALKLDIGDEGESVIAKGREAVARRVRQKVLQDTGNDIPDEIVVTVPVYDVEGFRDHLKAITILIDVGLREGSPVFEATAVHNDVRAAERDALMEVVMEFEGEFEVLGVKPATYHGTV